VLSLSVSSISLRSSSSCFCRAFLLWLLHSVFPTIKCSRRQFLRKMWPIPLAFHLFIVCRIFLFSLSLRNTSSFLTQSVRLIIHPSPAPLFKSLQVFLIYFLKCPSFSPVQTYVPKVALCLAVLLFCAISTQLTMLYPNLRAYVQCDFIPWCLLRQHVSALWGHQQRMNTHTRYVNYLLQCSLRIRCYINETYNEIELKFCVSFTDLYISD
jgi:hypothetical protein